MAFKGEVRIHGDRREQFDLRALADLIVTIAAEEETMTRTASRAPVEIAKQSPTTPRSNH